MHKYTARIVVVIVLLLALIGAPAAEAAIITTPFAEFGNGAVVINYDRNDGSGNVLRFRVINNSDLPAWFGVFTCPDGVCTLLGGAAVAGGVTFEQGVPGVTVRWVCVPDPPWPDDCGLQMGDYQFRARWPAY